MKKLIVVGISLLLLAAFAPPANADVNVVGNITKIKTVLVTVDVEKIRLVDIDVVGDIELDGGAEAEAIANVTNEGNTVIGQQGESGNLTPDNLFKNSRLLDSANDNVGIVGINQDVGNMQNQGNLASVSVTDTQTALAHAEASVSQDINSNYVNEREALGPDNLPVVPDLLDGQIPADLTEWHRQALIINSVKNHIGIIGVNQSSGNMNNQTNAVAVAAGLEGVQVALAEADLGQFNIGSTMDEIQTFKRDLIQDSVNFNHGVVTVNQSSGNMNNQSSVISLAVQ